jgi:precorrin-6B methylase 2
MRCFQYGFNEKSTFFLSELCGELVVAIHESSQYESLTDNLLSNIRTIYAETVPTFIDVISREDDTFDVIMIDTPKFSGSCLKHAPERLAAGGFIVLNFSQQPELQRAMSSFDPQEWDRVTYYGVGDKYFLKIQRAWATTFFWKRDNHHE